MPNRLKLIGSLLAALIALVGGFEGVRTVAYRDSVGVPTICYGETLNVHMGDRKSLAECKAMFAKRLLQFADKMESCIKRPGAIPDKAYLAFASLTYNIGSGAFCQSTLAKKLNAGDLRGACQEILKWDRAGGAKLPGLTNRRQAEYKLCMEGVR